MDPEEQKDKQNEFMDETLSSHKPPEKEEPATPPTGNPAPETPPEGEEPEGDDPAPKSDEQELLEWLGERKEAKTPEDEEEDDPSPAGDPETPLADEIDELDLDEDAFDAVTTSPEALKDYAKRIYDKAQKDVAAQTKALREEFQQELANAKEELLKNIPTVVSKSVERTQTVKNLVSNFYNDYPALKEKKAYVKDMIATVSSQQPDWSAPKVLQEVATRAQRDFNLHQQAEQREKERKPNPTFAGAGGRRSPDGQSDNRSKQERLLDDTFK